MNKKIKIYIFCFLILLLVLPAIQKETKMFHIKGLNGSYTLAQEKKLTLKSWFNSQYQKQCDKYLEDHIGFRNMFIRLFNQLDFSLFNKSHAQKVEIGKNGYLYEKRYIRSYLGINFAGENKLNNKVLKTKAVQDSLKNKDVHLLVLIAPGKADYYPEYLLSRYDKIEKTQSNYEFVKQKFDAHGINYIDFNSYFLEMKDTTSLPLFPKCGVHWSYYSMKYVIDSLIKYIETVKNIDMPDLYIDSVELTTHPKFTDYDIGDALNIYSKIPQDTLAYPVFRVENDSTKVKPDVLIIGDSFYWTFSQTELPEKIFKMEDFWYYLKEVNRKEKFPVNILNFKNEILSKDIIVLWTTVAQFHDYDFGFANKMFQKLNNNDEITESEIREKLIEYYTDQIKNNADWLEHIAEKARKNNIPLEEMIRNDAEYMVDKKNNKN
ncbi:MAG: hypothetical protein KAT68_11080 [Bacteroidales bacterium]|nr:hypothetical protein [Bacteroidales bacterium]